MRPELVVVALIFSQDLSQVPLAMDQMVIEAFAPERADDNPTDRPVPTRNPRPSSSPRMRRCPTADSPVPTAGSERESPQRWVAGRVRRGRSTSFFTSQRCHASSVPGVTMRCSRRRAGNSLANAAGNARSAQSGLGRSIWRRSTATSCRNTKLYFASHYVDADRYEWEPDWATRPLSPRRLTTDE